MIPKNISCLKAKNNPNLDETALMTEITIFYWWFNFIHCKLQSTTLKCFSLCTQPLKEKYDFFDTIFCWVYDVRESFPSWFSASSITISECKDTISRMTRLSFSCRKYIVEIFNSTNTFFPITNSLFVYLYASYA